MHLDFAVDTFQFLSIVHFITFFKKSSKSLEMFYIHGYVYMYIYIYVYHIIYHISLSRDIMHGTNDMLSYVLRIAFKFWQSLLYIMNCK